MQSIEALGDSGGYFDLFLIHWPVPGCFVETYKELEVLHEEGKLKCLGLSNFSPSEYADLMAEGNGIRVAPVVNQFEVSPFMYRPNVVSYFQERGVLVSSSKALHRGESFDNAQLEMISRKHSVSPAQVVLRWGLQKGLVVVAKTAKRRRMKENRDILHFVLSEDDMTTLNGLTSAEDVVKREKLEKERKLPM